MRGASTARRHPPVRLSQRDIDGLLLCGEHYGAPLDLLAGALGVSQVRMNAIATRWRRAGYVDATAAYVALRSAWAQRGLRGRDGRGGRHLAAARHARGRGVAG